jgi:beta-N-acetylhexosaminidase
MQVSLRWSSTFPGLGRVVPNTDVSSDVRDTATTRNDPALEPFHAAIKSGTQWVMVSNAYYDKIDPANIAPFSPTVMDTMLRADAGFKGIVLSDDLCSAAQLEAWSDADRALNFFGAGEPCWCAPIPPASRQCTKPW